MDAKRRPISAVWPLLLLAIWSEVSQAHVALTFPPARQPALDFLDSGRTPPPCGVPKGIPINSYIIKTNKQSTVSTMGENGSYILFDYCLIVCQQTRLRSVDCQLNG